MPRQKLSTQKKVTPSLPPSKRVSVDPITVLGVLVHRRTEEILKTHCRPSSDELKVLARKQELTLPECAELIIAASFRQKIQFKDCFYYWDFERGLEITQIQRTPTKSLEEFWF